MTGVLLSSTIIDHVAIKLQESLTCSEVLPSEWRLYHKWKILLYVPLTGNQTAKIIVLAYGDRVSLKFSKF